MGTVQGVIAAPQAMWGGGRDFQRSVLGSLRLLGCGGDRWYHGSGVVFHNACKLWLDQSSNHTKDVGGRECRDHVSGLFAKDLHLSLSPVDPGLVSVEESVP